MTATYHRTQEFLDLIEALGPTWTYQRDGYFVLHLPRLRGGPNDAEVKDRWYEVAQDPDDQEVWNLCYLEATAYSTSPEPETTESFHEGIAQHTEIRELFEMVYSTETVAS